MRGVFKIAWQVCISFLFMWICGIYTLSIPGISLPITLQSMFAIALPLTLEPRNARGGILLYVLLGALGLHVFANGAGGPEHLMGRSGGYLLGFYLISNASGIQRHFLKLGSYVSYLFTFILLHIFLTILGIGWIWFSMREEITFSTHVLPFIPGLVVKSFAGAAIVWVFHKFMAESNSKIA